MLPGRLVLGQSRRYQNPWVLSLLYQWHSVQFSCSVVSDSLRPHRLQHTRLLRPWDSPGKSTRVGCHCLLWQVSLNRINQFLWASGKGSKESMVSSLSFVKISHLSDSGTIHLTRVGLSSRNEPWTYAELSTCLISQSTITYELAPHLNLCLETRQILFQNFKSSPFKLLSSQLYFLQQLSLDLIQISEK